MSHGRYINGDLVMDVLDSPELKPAVLRLTLLVLARHADANGECYPSYARIAAQSGVMVRQAIRNVARLEELGFVAKLGVKSRGGSNLYRVTPTPYVAHDTCDTHDDEPMSSETPTRGTDDIRTSQEDIQEKNAPGPAEDSRTHSDQVRQLPTRVRETRQATRELLGIRQPAEVAM